MSKLDAQRAMREAKFARDQARAQAREHPAEVDPFADGYPVPPMPGQTLVEPRHRAVGSAAPGVVPGVVAASVIVPPPGRRTSMCGQPYASVPARRGRPAPPGARSVGAAP